MSADMTQGTKWIRMGAGGDFLLCPKCGAGIFESHYLKAVAVAGFRFCPYCGEDLKDDEE